MPTTSPPLPPPPPPVPAPRETAVPNVPPEVLSNLTHHMSWADWFYNSAATLIGAGVALIAAGIAFWAVKRQIAASARHVTTQMEANELNVAKQIAATEASVAKQIAANEANVAAQIAAEEKHRRRVERVAVVPEAHEMMDTLMNRKGVPPEESPLARQQWEAEDLRVRTIAARLYLLAMTEESTALLEFWRAADSWARSPMKMGPGGMMLSNSYGKTMEALKKALDN